MYRFRGWVGREKSEAAKRAQARRGVVVRRERSGGVMHKAWRHRAGLAVWQELEGCAVEGELCESY